MENIRSSSEHSNTYLQTFGNSGASDITKNSNPNVSSLPPFGSISQPQQEDHRDILMPIQQNIVESTASFTQMQQSMIGTMSPLSKSNSSLFGSTSSSVLSTSSEEIASGDSRDLSRLASQHPEGAQRHPNNHRETTLPPMHQQYINSLQRGPSTAEAALLRSNIDGAEKYLKISEIGKGAYGTVYKASDKVTGDIVAMKQIRFVLTEDGVPMSILREIALLKQLQKFNHPNVVRLLDVAHGQRLEREMSLYLIFEHLYCDLSEYLADRPVIGEATVKDMMFQVLRGVDFLHSHRIIHRDLKPQNLLVTRDGRIKITDFGLARIYDFYSLLTSVVVTLWYRSPEVLLALPYATPVDVWACGCIFAELFTRRAFIMGQTEIDQLTRIFSIIGTPHTNEWPSETHVMRSNFITMSRGELSQLIPNIPPLAKDLINQMLVFDPNLRINANEALHHNYFNEYRRQYLFSGLNHFSMNHDNPSSATNARIHPSETEGTFQAQTQLSSGEHPTNNADYKSSLSSISTLSSSEDQLSSNSISPSFSSVHAFPR